MSTIPTPNWQQYSSRAKGDARDYWQRGDGNAEVVECTEGGFRLNVWAVHEHGRWKGHGYMKFVDDYPTAEAAMIAAEVGEEFVCPDCGHSHCECDNGPEPG